jgi:hypothetical protein
MKPPRPVRTIARPGPSEDRAMEQSEREIEARRRIRLAVRAYEQAVEIEARHEEELKLAKQAHSDRFCELRRELIEAGYHQVTRGDKPVGVLVGNKVWWAESDDHVRSVALDVDPRGAER